MQFQYKTLNLVAQNDLELKVSLIGISTTCINTTPPKVIKSHVHVCTNAAFLCVA